MTSLVKSTTTTSLVGPTQPQQQRGPLVTKIIKNILKIFKYILKIIKFILKLIYLSFEFTDEVHQCHVNSGTQEDTSSVGPIMTSEH